MNPLDAALAAGATARLTRLVTTDDLGRHFVDPVQIALVQRGVEPWVAAGLDCPYCVGYWLGTAVLASHALASRTRPTHAAWRFVAGSLALNYVVGAVEARL